MTVRLTLLGESANSPPAAIDRFSKPAYENISAVDGSHPAD
jgi:hypothetical protein